MPMYFPSEIQRLDHFWNELLTTLSTYPNLLHPKVSVPAQASTTSMSMPSLTLAIQKLFYKNHQRLPGAVWFCVNSLLRCERWSSRLDVKFCEDDSQPWLHIGVIQELSEMFCLCLTPRFWFNGPGCVARASESFQPPQAILSSKHLENHQLSCKDSLSLQVV